MLTPQRFTHHSRAEFKVKAMQISAENIAEVARWCGGEIYCTTQSLTKPHLYIDFKLGPAYANLRGRAFETDWIFKEGIVFRFYTADMFDNAFHPFPSEEARHRGQS